jgi:hypothetical protein
VVHVDNEPRPAATRLNKIKPISELVGAFKTTSSKMIHQAGLPEFAWQRSFYDHIIRDDEERWYIQKYIRDNPKAGRKTEIIRHFFDQANNQIKPIMPEDRQRQDCP